MAPQPPRRPRQSSSSAADDAAANRARPEGTKLLQAEEKMDRIAQKVEVTRSESRACHFILDPGGMTLNSGTKQI